MACIRDDYISGFGDNQGNNGNKIRALKVTGKISRLDKVGEEEYDAV